MKKVVFGILVMVIKRLMMKEKQIIRICPDYNYYLWDSDDVAIDLIDLLDNDGRPIIMPELDEWAKENRSIIVASETGYPYEKDWEDYHKRGLSLAHHLRGLLPCNYELWYEAPFEDKSGIIPQSLKII